MKIYILVALALACTELPNVTAFFDPVSIGLAVGAGLGLYNFNSIKCNFVECCNSENIPANINSLKYELSRHLYGQHIVEQQLVPALQAHFTSNRHSTKPLVISFHGTPGTGKNFVADKIATTLYKKGLQSRFVHKYMGRADFPVNSEANIYSGRIIRDVRAAISECPRSLFIFDEVDKMPPKTFESLASLVNYHSFAGGADNTQAIFIFLSNTAGVQIADRLGSLLNDGTLRENTKLSQFEQILEATAYTQQGGLQKASLIEAHVIDHFIPFLPLEKMHIRKCLEAEFRRWGRNAREETLKYVAYLYLCRMICLFW